MTHDCHEALPGYDPAHTLHPGCAECEQRARDLDGILSLDRGNLHALWIKMVAREFTGWPDVATSDLDHQAARILYVVGVAVSKLVGNERMELLGLAWGDARRWGGAATDRS